MTQPSTPLELRADLCSPVAFHRVKALHLIEQLGEHSRDKRLAREVLDFTSRDIPYYSLDDQHFQSWVAQAVSLWQKARRVEPVPA